jgi:uncharacterized protein (DUF1501 family)
MGIFTGNVLGQEPTMQGQTMQGQTMQGQLVVIFLRGGMDGMHAIIPAGDTFYKDLRPELSLAAEVASDLDGFFRLHAQLAPLQAIYEQGDLAFIHACGSPDPSHSHFDCQDFMEHGTPGVKTTFDGWLARALSGGAPGSVLQAVAMGKTVPEVLRSQVIEAVALNSIAEFSLLHPSDIFAEQLAEIYRNDPALASVAVTTFNTIEALSQLEAASYQPAEGVVYPTGTFGKQLQDAALMLKSALGIRALNIDLGGWDSHNNQQAMLSAGFQQLAEGLAAFFIDLGELAGSTSIAVMTEFGRRAYENASAGTDHGHGSCMMVLGQGINGGKVYGEWPGLAPEALYGPGDLQVTTDYRTVLAELLTVRHGLPDTSLVFPDFPLGATLGICS